MSTETRESPSKKGRLAMKSHQIKTGSRRAKQFKALIASSFAIAAISAGPAGAHLAQAPSSEPQVGAESYRAGQTMRMSAAQRRECANSLIRKPYFMEGQVIDKGRKLEPTTELTSLGSAQCLRTAERKISIWAIMENNRHKMKRNTEVRTYNADPEEFFNQPPKNYDMFKRYTCEPGRGKRLVKMVARISVSFSGYSKKYTRKHRANGNAFNSGEPGQVNSC
jgi:hypothetical protein